MHHSFRCLSTYSAFSIAPSGVATLFDADEATRIWDRVFKMYRREIAPIKNESE